MRGNPLRGRRGLLFERKRGGKIRRQGGIPPERRERLDQLAEGRRLLLGFPFLRLLPLRAFVLLPLLLLPQKPCLDRAPFIVEHDVDLAGFVGQRVIRGVEVGWKSIPLRVLWSGILATLDVPRRGCPDVVRLVARERDHRLERNVEQRRRRARVPVVSRWGEGKISRWRGGGNLVCEERSNGVRKEVARNVPPVEQISSHERIVGKLDVVGGDGGRGHGQISSGRGRDGARVWKDVAGFQLDGRPKVGELGDEQLPISRFQKIRAERIVRVWILAGSRPRDIYAERGWNRAIRDAENRLEKSSVVERTLADRSVDRGYRWRPGAGVHPRRLNILHRVFEAPHDPDSRGYLVPIDAPNVSHVLRVSRVLETL